MSNDIKPYSANHVEGTYPDDKGLDAGFPGPIPRGDGQMASKPGAATKDVANVRRVHAQASSPHAVFMESRVNLAHM